MHGAAMGHARQRAAPAQRDLAGKAEAKLGEENERLSAGPWRESGRQVLWMLMHTFEEGPWAADVMLMHRPFKVAGFYIIALCGLGERRRRMEKKVHCKKTPFFKKKVAQKELTAACVAVTTCTL